MKIAEFKFLFFVEIMAVIGVDEVTKAAAVCGKSVYVGFSYEKVELPELCKKYGVI